MINVHYGLECCKSKILQLVNLKSVKQLKILEYETATDIDYKKYTSICMKQIMTKTRTKGKNQDCQAKCFK